MHLAALAEQTSTLQCDGTSQYHRRIFGPRSKGANAEVDLAPLAQPESDGHGARPMASAPAPEPGRQPHS
jgi:hypothetical protein